MTQPPSAATPDRESVVRRAFAGQARWCDDLGSPFTAELLRLLGARLDRRGAIGRRVLDWEGRPDGAGDSVPLRLAGGLHALARRGAVAALSAVYPPAPRPTPEALWEAVAAALAVAEAELLPWLDGPPQTNEIGRSCALFAGLMAAVAGHGLPLDVFELGASAGLNQNLDRYAYRLGGVETGAAGSPVRLTPAWEGPDPPRAAVRIRRRRAVDISPIDLAAAGAPDRLLAYVWPDQRERVERLEAALAIAARHPPTVERADAAAWIETVLHPAPEPGVARVVLHSIAFQYFPEGVQARVARHIEAVGRAATAAAPLHWLAFEMEPALKAAGLRLTTWPGGDNRLLAACHPHATSVRWF